MTTKNTLSGLSNDELLSEVKRLAHNAYEAELWSGALFLRETRGAWSLPTEGPSAMVGRTWSRPSFHAQRARGPIGNGVTEPIP
jgi:hypothetical protein